MIKSDYDAKNFVYVLSTNDELEHILAVVDTMQELADILNLDLSSISRYVSRHSNGENLTKYKNRKIERVKIYDYIYVIYEHDLTKPLYVSRDIKKLKQLIGCSFSSITRALHDRPKYIPKLKKLPTKHKLFGKYMVKQIDLLDEDINLAKYLESCIDKENITTNFNDFMEVEI